MKKIGFIAVALATVLLVGCKPTPEPEPATGGGSGGGSSSPLSVLVLAMIAYFARRKANK
jgi:formiminotetrahydrofolate cyclodeaminase